jgi:hypothetical protein
MLIAFVVASAGLLAQAQLCLPYSVQAARAAEVERLITAATPLLAKSDHYAKYPIEALGIMRAEEAIPLLVKHLCYTPPAVKTTPSDEFSGKLSDMLPCVHAISKIGHVAFDAVVKKACETDDDGHVICAAITLRVSFGADDAITLLQARVVSQCKEDRDKSRINKIILSIDKTYRQVHFR